MKLSKSFLLLLLLQAFLYVFAIGQSPTSPAQGFNVFLKNNATLITNESEGPVALGGNLTLAGDYRVANNYTGTFKVSNVPIGLLVGGKVIYSSGNGLTVNQSCYVKIGDCSGSTVWYKDNNNAYSNMQITNGSYNATPRINIQTNSQNLGVSATVNPVCQGSLIDFGTAFTTMQASSTSISACTSNADLTNPNGNVHGTTITSVLTGGQLKINLNAGTNVLNVTGAELNNVTNGITFNNQPDASHVLVINVNASGSFTWNVWNQAGIGGSNAPYILYNFYNTTSLNIAGNSTIEGTVFAPYADITKTVNQSNIEGQIIGLSYYQSGGENHYFNFTPTVTGCGGGCSNPIVADISGSSTVCKNATITLTDATASGTWSSSNTNVATVSSSGVVTGIAGGTVTISYSVSNACGITSKTISINVNEGPSAPVVTLTQPTCSVATGSIAIISPNGIGMVYTIDGTNYQSGTTFSSVAAGNYNLIKAKNAGGCISTATSATINAQPVAPTVADISGSTTVCKNATITLTDATASGTWSSSNTSLATVSSGGVVTGVAAGSAIISYSVSNDCGITSKTKTIIVSDVIAVNDISGTANMCKGSTTTLSNITVGGVWSSSNTNIATVDANGVVTGVAAGTATISYSVTNSCGVSTKSLGVTVYDTPSSAFTVNNPSQELTGNNFIFTNTGSTSGNAYSWNFGDATTSSSVNPSKTYAAQGSYHITLNVVNSNGCSSTSTGNVSVANNSTVPTTIIPGFHVDSDYQCVTNNHFNFTNISISKCGCLTYLWSFGDGTTSTETNPSKSYAAAGEYAVKLVITDKDHRQDSVTYHVFVVGAPTMNFTANPRIEQCFKGNQFTFTNTSNSTFSGLKYSWDFGNGTSSTDVNPSIVYASAGNYTVTLNGTLNGVCPASITKTIKVYPMPVVDFTFATDASNNKKINFTNASTISNGSLDYNWFFGDNNSAVDVNTTNTYANNGVYNVKLVASSKNGCTETITKSVVVGTNVFAVGFGVGTGTQCLTGNSFSFTNNSIGTTGSHLTYAWSFGDGTTSTDANPVKSYTAAGDYTVKLHVISDHGETGTSTTTVHVLASPTAQFTVSPTTEYCLSANNIFNFTNTSTIPSGANANYQWTLDNGRIVNNTNATAAYNSAGVYPVVLTVKLDNGCTNSTTKNITVKPAPSVNFVFGADKNNYKSISFENASHISTGTLAYNWSFADGTNSSSTTPTHLFANNGTYAVKLVSTSNEYGCKDSVTKSIVIKDSLFASFDANNFCQCVTTNGFAFSNESGGSVGPYTYTWDFGDGTTSAKEYPKKVYTTSGNYNVKLTVTNSHAVVASQTRLIRVGSKPVAGFNAVANSTYSYSFINTSTIPTGLISSYWWSFGDGTISADVNPSKVFSAPGTYYVQLIAVGDGSCSDTITKTITITEPSATICTTASFNVNDSSQCITDNHYVFTNTTVPCSGCALTYEWNFGDGTFAYTRDAEKIYSHYGEYDVVMKITDCHGNSTQTVRQLYVGDKPHASYNILTNTGSGHDYTFISTSTVVLGPISYNWNFGGGVTSTLVNPTLPLSAGTHNVQLIVNGRGTCKDTVTQVVNVVAAPVADFTFSRSGCTNAAEAFIFNNTTTGGVPTVTYLWNFGDGNTSTQKNPTHYYLYPNTYTITLTATDATNNSSTKSVAVQSLGGAAPHADFNIISNTANGSSYTYISTSTIASGWMTYAWSLGDGTTSTLVNPTKTYTVVGNYNVKLVVTGSSGCTDSITKTVNVNSVSNSIATPPVTIFPNPVVDNTVVGFTPTTMGAVSVRVINNIGQVVKTQSVAVLAANARINTSVNMSNLTRGSYFIVLIDANGNTLSTTPVIKN